MKRCIVIVFSLFVLSCLGVSNINVYASELKDYQFDTEIPEVDVPEARYIDEIPEEFQSFFNKPDYEVVQSDDGSGNSVWYLLNNIDGTRTKISEFNNIVSDAEAREGRISQLEKSVKRWKILFWISVVIIVGVLVGEYILFIGSRKKRHKKRKATRRKNEDVDMRDLVDKSAIRYNRDRDE